MFIFITLTTTTTLAHTSEDSSGDGGGVYDPGNYCYLCGRGAFLPILSLDPLYCWLSRLLCLQ